MRFVLVYLPLILLAVGALLGLARFWRAAVVLGICLLGGEALLALGMMQVIDPLAGLLLFIVLMPLSFWFATLFSFAASKHAEPPVMAAVEAYRGLDPDMKDKLRRGARLALKFGAKHAGNHLRDRDRGHARAADALHEGSRII